MTNRKISNLDLKIKITNEYLNNGGAEKTPPEILKEFLKVKIGEDGKVDPDTVSTFANTAMGALLHSHLTPPFYHPESISEYQSTLQKSNSFVQENIDTEEQFDKIYDEFKIKTDTLFRGQNEAKWRLYNKLQRLWITEKLFENGKSYQTLIERLVETGNIEFGEQIKKLLMANHIDTENSVSVLSYLQHHGCPTPLLDWTYKFQIALYFALDGLTNNPGTIEIGDYCSVYFIEEKDLEEANLRDIIFQALDSQEAPELQRLIARFSNGDGEKEKAMQVHFAGRKVFDRNKLNGAGLISHMTKVKHIIDYPILYFSDKDKDSEILFSLNNNRNILNQVGVFMWNSDPSKPIEMVGDELYKEGKLEDEKGDYRFCHCFNIHKRLEGYIRKRLEADGITKEFIYPNPDASTWGVFEKCKAKENG